MDDDKIIVPYHLSESFIDSHPEWTFLFGWDYLRKGALGQCVNFVFDGKPKQHCYPIPTAYKWCANPVYFQDNIEYYMMVAKAFKEIPSYKPIIPCRRIGEGCSRLKELAPSLLMTIKSRIKEIKYPELYIDYGTCTARLE